MNESLKDLTASVDRLANETHSLRADVRKRTAALWVGVLACALAVIVIGAIAFTVGLSNRRAIQENNLRWCPMVAVLLPAPGETAPTTERGRILVANAKQLYQDFGCA